MIPYFNIIVAICVIIGGFLIKHYYTKWRRRQKWNAIGKDKVVLHTIPECLGSNPNLGPFNVKLETFLRMARIPYEHGHKLPAYVSVLKLRPKQWRSLVPLPYIGSLQIDTEDPMGPKGKTPWITFNGEDYSDSQLIIEFLSDHFRKKFSEDLTKEEKAVARSFQIMAEEHLYWGLVSWRYDEDTQRKVLELSDKIPSIIRNCFPYRRMMVKRYLYYQGLGRHTHHEIRSIMRKDILALSHYLGEKKFFMGDQPREIDCCIYGQLCEFVWNAPGSPYEKMIKDDCKNLYDYCSRMKEKFYGTK